jgi:hypothetical protein
MDLRLRAGGTPRHLPHDWRRHSFTRARRSAGADQLATTTTAQAQRFSLPQVSSSQQQVHTTHDDIAW